MRLSLLVAPFGRLAQLFLELFRAAARPADGVDLLLDLPGAFLDSFLGDLLVVEDHQLANGPVAGMQPVPELDDVPGDERGARNRLDDRQLAALDAAGDLDFSLAGEQRHRAHLAEIHADRIVGLVERARREIELELFGAFGGPVEALFVPEILLIGVDDLDPGAAKGVEEVVQLVRGGNLRRQQLVHLVVQEVAFLLADRDELPHFVVSFLDRQVRVLARGRGGCRVRAGSGVASLFRLQMSSSIR